MILLSLGMCACALNAQDVSPPERTVPGRTLWRASVTALAVANAVDMHSSWGRHELNSTLSGPSGRFGRDGALVKLGFQGGLIGFEYLITRGHPSRRLYRSLSVINFGVSATMGGVAAHNYTVPGGR